MTDERTVMLDMEYDAWTVEEMHAYFEAVGANAVVAAAHIDDALNADFRDLVTRCMGDDEKPPEVIEAPPDWQPLNLLGIDPYYILGFAWIPARRSEPDLTFDAFKREVNGGELLAAYVEHITSLLPEPPTEGPGDEAQAAPFASSPPPKKTSPRSRTKSSRPTGSSKRSGKSARSATTSSK